MVHVFSAEKGDTYTSVRYEERYITVRKMAQLQHNAGKERYNANEAEQTKEYVHDMN